MKIRIPHHKFLSINIVQHMKLSYQERRSSHATCHLAADNSRPQEINTLQKAKGHFRGSCKNAVLSLTLAYFKKCDESLSASGWSVLYYLCMHDSFYKLQWFLAAAGLL